MIDPLPLLIAAGCLAAVLLHAAWPKLADRALFHQHLAAYGVPEPLQLPLVWMLPLAEGSAALGLITASRSFAALGAAALLLSYGAAMAWHLGRGRRLDCGCGGAPILLSGWLLLRNAVLVAIALLASLPSDGRMVGGADLAVAAAAVALAAVLYAAFHQLLRQQPALASATTSNRSSV